MKEWVNNGTITDGGSLRLQDGKDGYTLLMDFGSGTFMEGLYATPATIGGIKYGQRKTTT
jgi:hypothetical protein